MVSLQVPEPNSTLVKLHDYCKQHCTFSDYINFTVGRGQQLLSARPTASLLIKVKLMPPWFTLVVQGIIYSGSKIIFQIYICMLLNKERPEMEDLKENNLWF